MRLPCAWCMVFRKRCRHKSFVVQALPGATFRTTKYEFNDSGCEVARKVRPWTPPADIGAAFRKAIQRPIPTEKDVT